MSEPCESIDRHGVLSSVERCIALTVAVHKHCISVKRSRYFSRFLSQIKILHIFSNGILENRKRPQVSTLSQF